MDKERSWRGRNPGGAVPVVEVADLRAVWETCQDFAARHPGKQVAAGAAVIEEACRQGVDIEAVMYRYWMLLTLVREVLRRPAGPLETEWAFPRGCV